MSKGRIENWGRLIDLHTGRIMNGCGYGVMAD